MSIVSSVFMLDGTAQHDGRQYVRETHTDNIGKTYIVRYMAAVGTDYQAVANARAPTIAEQIAAQEFSDAAQADTRPVLAYNTLAQFVARFRAAYLNSSQQVAAALAWWIVQRINAGDVTDQQCATAFGLTLVNWNTLRTNRINPQHDAWATVLAAQGQ